MMLGKETGTMTQDTTLAVREQGAMTLQDTMTLGQTLARSGYFSDAREAAQAVVKILAGREMGFGPIASMTGINIIQGRVATSANLMAAAVQASGRYSFRVKELTPDVCRIAFYEGQEQIGLSVFTLEDARKAGTKNLDRFPRNMLYARAMSNGVRWYCPSVMSGQPVYTPEELGATVNEDGEVIDVAPTALNPEPKAPTTNSERVPAQPVGDGQGRRLLTPEEIRAAVRRKAGWNGHRLEEGEPITEKQIPTVAMLLAKASLADDPDRERHTILSYLFGVESTHQLTKREAAAIIDWLVIKGTLELNEYAPQECAAILKAAMIEAGQQEMPL